MRSFKARSLSQMVLGASALAIATAPGLALAQDAATTMGNPGTSETQDTSASTETQTATEGEIVVTGIRASLRESLDIKRSGQGVVDAISAEDIGKFPDTNLAESLQRITGVSIDRQNGEGSTVTVRGFGPEYNLVILNGRQLPTATLGDGFSAPSSRSFDFANLASEGIASLEVYKSGRATVPSGGIGSTINIRTPRPLDRPGLRGSIAAKGVIDTSQNGKNDITPEVSGILSSTFADDRIGILLTGVYQKRNASVNQANVGYRDGYLGAENNWGSLAQQGDPRFANITNRPGPTDVYEVPQNANYALNDLKRERINGQLVLQFKPLDSLTATADFTYSRNDIEVRSADVGIWFNHNDTSSAWTDGPVAGPEFYTERFRANENKDLAYSGALTASRTENKSFGGNLTWEAPGGVTVSLDGHHSTAEAKPTNQYGNSVSVGTAIFGVATQTIDFQNDLPVISFGMQPGIDPLNAALITPTGNAFRNSYFRDRINQIQVKGQYDHEGGFLDSIDFGVQYTDNKVRSAYGVLQNDTWGGTGGDSPAQRAAAAAALPDDIFTRVSIPDKFKGISGADDPGMVQSFYRYDFERLVSILDDMYNICGGDGDCRVPFTTDRRIREKTVSPYFQFNFTRDVFNRPAHLIAGLRYENTVISSSSLVPIPQGTRQNSPNEFNVVLTDANGVIQSDFTRFKGSYDAWLPAVDFDVEPLDGVKLRASYSHTITRADYGSLQGGRTVDLLFRAGGNGTGSQGNPGLKPFLSKNIDLSAEWYYSRESYLSVGYFRKTVSNYIGNTQVSTPAFGLTDPSNGPRYRAAIAALGPNAGFPEIRDYIAANFPGTVQNGTILGLPEDAPVNFVITTPSNSDDTAKFNGFEFAIQHAFWDTGFGTILNYTMVDSNRDYDNTLPATINQFAINGISDSANAVLFYDKFGFQARVAYNWRDKFLSGGGINPFYVEEYGQVDASASYEFIPGVTGFVEAINLTGADRRGHRRSDRNVFFSTRQDARYSAGLRFSFGGR
ncbi:MAG TPA: TonB-dependent receptor [Sphingomonas sp.]|jgi:TonB-dependent receptor